MEEINDELLDKVRKYALASEKPARYEHSVRVAQMAQKLCELYGLDAKLGYFAGIAHDMCKDLSAQTQMLLASHDGKPISALEQRRPELLHGRAAAYKLKSDFGVTNAAVLEAVARHTLGGEGMCNLAKIVYVADKIEPGRPQSTEEYRAALLKKTLDELTLFVVEENMGYLRSEGKDVAPESLRFRDDVKRQIEGNRQ